MNTTPAAKRLIEQLEKLSNKKVVLKENIEETKNYMFCQNLKTIKRMVDELLELDEQAISSVLANGHEWAEDHISTSKDDIEEVHNFLKESLLN